MNSFIKTTQPQNTASSAIRVGSLFSGIGGFELGLMMAGWPIEVAWQVEIDPWCRRVLAKHWPETIRHEDIRECGQHNLSPIDIIVGGFPCQDLSYAGRGAGLAGERSGLWWEMHRVIGELRPRLILVENVPALLGRGMGDVLGSLAAIGYDAEWDCVPACAVGAPHRRDRVWIVGYAHRNGESVRAEHDETSVMQEDVPHAPRQRCRPGRAGGTAPLDEGGDAAGAHPHAGRELLEGRQSPGPVDGPDLRDHAGWWAVESPVGRVADGIPRRVDRLRGLGNAVVPQVVAYIARRIREAGCI